jgi:hypothetical protein
MNLKLSKYLDNRGSKKRNFRPEQEPRFLPQAARHLN